MGIPAVEAVLSSPELLEAVLIHLPMRDVLITALRLNRTWNATITNSPTLQRYLFFAPIIQSPADEPKWTQNPLLIEKFPAWFNDIRATTRYFIDPKTLTDPQEIFHYGGKLGPYKRFHFTHIRALSKTELGARSEAFCHPAASWRRMLVMQPRVNLVKIVHASNVHKRWGRQRETKEFGGHGGLRMDYLYDFVIEEIYGSYRQFGLQWNMCSVEEDKETCEDIGMDDYLYRGPLVEKGEKRDSVTLILIDTNPRAGRGKKGEGQLGAQLKSKAVRVEASN